MKIHFIGIGGIGLSAIARFLKHNKHEISGSDIKQTSITSQLIKEGINVTCPQSANNIKDDFDIVIYSAALTDDNPELIQSRVKANKNIIKKRSTSFNPWR